jgi:hypothetical protein
VIFEKSPLRLRERRFFEIKKKKLSLFYGQTGKKGVKLEKYNQ